MVYKCCVPACRGNYDENSKVTVFSFPKDETEKRLWIQAIPRKNFHWTNHMRVCEKHFRAEDILTETSAFDEKKGVLITAPINRHRLKPGAVPSIFPGCPVYFSKDVKSRISPTEKRILSEQHNIMKAVEESRRTKESYDAARAFSNIDELYNCEKMFSCSSFWDIIRKESNVLYMYLKASEDSFDLYYMVIVDKELNLKVYIRGKPIPSLAGKYNFPIHVENLNEVHEILEYLEHVSRNDVENISHTYLDICLHFLTLVSEVLDKKKTQIDFLKEQLKLLSHKPERYEYSSVMMIFSTMFHLISPQGYKYVRDMGVLTLPHPSTIHKLCSKLHTDPCFELTNKHFLSYIKEKVCSLKEHDLTVSLMMDEIHIKPFIDYKGGNIVGFAYDDNNLATSAFVFMIQSFLSATKEVVHILPAKKMSADMLYNVLREIILGLEAFGFKVIIVVSDNNAINRKCMSYFQNPLANFVYPHPVNPLRPLFYAVDTVHLIKCVRNNWINQKNNEQALYFPDFNLTSNKVRTASFLSVKKLYEIENGNLLKFAYKLTRKALWPNNLERQNVKLALQVFDKNTVKGLTELAKDNDNINFNDTAAFIDIFHSWFSIVNVKTPYKGAHARNVFYEPLTLKADDPKLVFLTNFLDWLKNWKDRDFDTGKLTKETHSALILTTTTIIELTKYCINELNMSYVLPGKVQTDELEYRFSLYRRLAGANYNISIRQVFEIEKKIRTCSVLKLSMKSHSKGEIYINNLCTDDNFENLSETELDVKFYDINVTKCDFSNLGDSIVIIAYLAGYCIHSVCKRLKCEKCKINFITEKVLIIDPKYRLIHDSDRGGLKYPISEIISIVAYNFITLQKIITEKYEKLFLNSPNQKAIVSTLTINMLFQNDMFIPTCENHLSEDIISMIVSSSTNTLLKNYCRNKSDIFKKATSTNKKSDKSYKRKLSTLKGTD